MTIGVDVMTWESIKTMILSNLLIPFCLLPSILIVIIIYSIRTSIKKSKLKKLKEEETNQILNNATMNSNINQGTVISERIIYADDKKKRQKDKQNRA